MNPLDFLPPVYQNTGQFKNTNVSESDPPEFQLNFLYPEKASSARRGDIYFKLGYPETWTKEHRFIHLENINDLHDINEISLFGRFKAISRELEVENESHLFFKLPDNTFTHLAEIDNEHVKWNHLTFRLKLPDNHRSKASITYQILNEKLDKVILSKEINHLAQLFFSIIAFKQKEKIGQTNWIEIHPKINTDVRNTQPPRKRRKTNKSPIEDESTIQEQPIINLPLPNQISLPESANQPPHHISNSTLTHQTNLQNLSLDQSLDQLINEFIEELVQNENVSEIPHSTTSRENKESLPSPSLISLFENANVPENEPPEFQLNSLHPEERNLLNSSLSVYQNTGQSEIPHSTTSRENKESLPSPSLISLFENANVPESEPPEFQLNFLHPEQTNYLSSKSITFKLNYPETWKQHQYQFINLENIHDQQDMNKIYLFGRFKAICRDPQVEKENHLFFKLPDDSFRPFVEILKAKFKNKHLIFELRQKAQCTKTFIINQILEEKLKYKIPTKIINERAQLFFRIVAFNQNMIIWKTNWIEIHSKKNKDNMPKNKSSISLDKNTTQEQPIVNLPLPYQTSLPESANQSPQSNSILTHQTNCQNLSVDQLINQNIEKVVQNQFEIIRKELQEQWQTQFQIQLQTFMKEIKEEFQTFKKDLGKS